MQSSGTRTVRSHLAGFYARPRGIPDRIVRSVPRNAGSGADRELTALLAARGLTGSTARYERWRQAGLLPSNERHGAGRGRGSTSALDPETVEIAATVARHTAQGRDLRIAVIAWFLEANPRIMPEPPHPAVVQALTWAVRTASPYRILRQVRAAVAEAEEGRSRTSEPGEGLHAPGAAVGLDLGAVRETLLTGRGLLATRLRAAEFRITGRRVAEPSLEVFARVFANLLAGEGLFPFLTSEQWRWAITGAQASGIDSGPFAALLRHDPVAVLADASRDQLRRAQFTALYLAGFGNVLEGRARMADSEETAEWRAYLKRIGVAPSLRYLARLMTLPREPAVVIAACLDPWYSSLEERLENRSLRKYETSAQPIADERDAWLATVSAGQEPLPADGKWVGSANRKRRRRSYVW